MITRRKYLGALVASLAASKAASESILPLRKTSQSRLTKSGKRQSGDLHMHIEEPEQDSDTAVLVLPRIYGVEEGMVNYAKQLTQQGMTAVVWDPYQGEAPQPMNGKSALEWSRKLEDKSALSNIKRAIDYMDSELGFKKISILGWCLGGRFAFLAAANDSRVQSVTVYHPTIYPAQPTTINAREVMPSKSPRGPATLTLHRDDVTGHTIDEFAEVEKITCPVRLIQPGKDLMQPADYDRLIGLLNQRSAITCVEYYPLASHGFSTRQEFEANAKAHSLSWPMTLSFIKNTRA